MEGGIVAVVPASLGPTVASLVLVVQRARQRHVSAARIRSVFRRTRVLTIGSVPPEWGGTTQGGVATFHCALVSEIARHPLRYRTRIVGVVPTNTESPKHVPVPTFHPGRDERVRDLYSKLIDRVNPNVVAFNHIANQWARTHAQIKPSIPGIGIVHSWHSLTFRRPGVDQSVVRERTQEAADGLDMLVFPSRFCLNEGIDHGFRYPSRTEVIHYPLGPMYSSTTAREVKLHERDGVAFVGALIERKNPVALAEAAIAGEFKARFAGEGDQRQRLEQLAAQVPDRIELLGARTMKQIRELMLRSELVCLPSSSESFGIVFIEAMACGTPVVGFAETLEEIFDTIRERFGEAVKDMTPDNLAAAIARVRTRTWPREEVHRAVLRKFAPGRVAYRYASAFAEVASGQERSRSLVDVYD
jgi:glycosyltransferase involved in cell wall biosynthesis